jgi:prevent-host-death family protein
MDQISVEQLSRDTAGILARVEAGETVEITRNGKPIARIIPVEPSERDHVVQT